MPLAAHGVAASVAKQPTWYTSLSGVRPHLILCAIGRGDVRRISARHSRQRSRLAGQFMPLKQRDATLGRNTGMTDAEKGNEAPEEATAATQEAAPASQETAPERPAPAKRRLKKAEAPKPTPYAIIETGGKQYRVSAGDRIAVERLVGEPGTEIAIDQVLLVSGDGTTKIGTPVVDGATVSATIDDHFRGDKIIVFKFKAKKRYRRRTGHRQELTHLVINGINA
jgi:large subunit ribosomal protein L21